MSFAVAAEAYDRFMGRYSTPLAQPFADFADIGSEPSVLDVGCGPGALTAELARRLGAAAVTAVDPSKSFVEALAQRHPDVTVQAAKAEALPFAAETFDAVLAQLVVHFMDEPVAGIAEMARVARPSSIVAACVWDHGGSHGPLSTFWGIARELDPDVEDESHLAGTTEGELAELFHAAGLRVTEDAILTVDVEHSTFDDWWEPYTLGVGPAGAYVAKLDDERRERLRERCEDQLEAPFVLTARAWATRARA